MFPYKMGKIIKRFRFLKGKIQCIIIFSLQHYTQAYHEVSATENSVNKLKIFLKILSVTLMFVGKAQYNCQIT